MPKKQKPTSWRTTYREVLTNGASASTQRAYTRDQHYFAEWYRLAKRLKLRYPVSVETMIQFIVEHTHSMPAAREKTLIDRGRKKRAGPIAISTLRRYLSSISVAHTERGVPSPVTDHRVKLLMRRVRRGRAGEASHKKAAITADLLKEMLRTCDNSLAGVRDRALLLVAFASGGRRRGELAALRVEDLRKVEGGYLLQLRRSKTDPLGAGYTVPILGKAASALRTWLVHSGVREGYIFRGFYGNGALRESIDGRTINRLVKERVEAIGLDPARFGAHSLRSGFVTEGGRQGAHLSEVMALSGHRDFEVAHHYFREGELLKNPAAYLFDGKPARRPGSKGRRKR